MLSRFPLGVSRYTVGRGVGAGRDGAVGLSALSLAALQEGFAKRV